MIDGARISLAAAPRSVRRVLGYLAGVFRRGLRWWRFDFDLISRTTGIAKRTLEWALRWLRTHYAGRFEFRTVRAGRSYAVQISDRNASVKGVSLRSKSKNTNTGRARVSAFGGEISEQGRGKLVRLAAFIARRDLAGAHWDNCKVRFGFGHAFNFALAMLRRGHERARIAAAYLAALRERHGDATDYGANHGDATGVRWAPSSTVSRARELLRDGREDGERVAERLRVLAPVKAAAVALARECRAAFAAPDRVSVADVLG